MTDSAAGPSMRAHLTSNRIRRHQPEAQQPRLADGAQPKLTAAEPPVPEKPPRPFGDLATASATQIADLAAEHFSVERNGRALSRHGMLWLLERLEEFPGRTWQQRWEAAGLNGPGHPVESLAGDDRQRRTRFNAAAQHAYCMRLIRPSVAAFNATRLFRYADRFRRVAGDPLLEEFCERLERQPVATDRRLKAILDICTMLTVYGIDLGGLTAEAVVHYAEQAPGFTAAATAWPVLHDMGRFPAWVPRTRQHARVRFFWLTQRAIAEMVSRYGGHVVNVSATIAEVANSGTPLVLAALTKGGLAAATRSLAVWVCLPRHLGQRRAPGVIQTTVHPAKQLPKARPPASLARPGRPGERRRGRRLAAGVVTVITGEMPHIAGPQSRLIAGY